MNNYIIFDIETMPYDKERIAKIIPPFEESEVKTGNYGPEKAREKIEQARENYIDDTFDKAAKDPLLSRVLVIGYKDLETGSSGYYSGSECNTLNNFWAHFDNPRNVLIGHNIYEFDLPFIYRRSLIHEVRIPDGVKKGRYWNERFIDTMKIWTMDEYGKRIKLDTLAKGLGHELGKHDKIKGKDFWKYWTSEDKADRNLALEYLYRDLELTEFVARKLNLIQEWSGI